MPSIFSSSSYSGKMCWDRGSMKLHFQVYIRLSMEIYLHGLSYTKHVPKIKITVSASFNCMFLLCHVRVSEWIYTLRLPECQGAPCLKQARYLKIKWLQRDSNLQQLASLVKWLSVRLRTKWFWVRVPLQSPTSFTLSKF